MVRSLLALLFRLWPPFVPLSPTTTLPRPAISLTRGANVFSSLELRELERKLKSAYMNKERAAQIAEKEVLKYEKMVRSFMEYLSLRNVCLLFFQ